MPPDDDAHDFDGFDAEEFKPLPKLREVMYEKHPPRKPLTREQILTLAIRQIDKSGVLRCGCGRCGEPLDTVCIDEHVIARETLPYPQCDALDNRALYNPPCSKAKTVDDQAIIGHWRRVRGASGQKKRMKEKGPVMKSSGRKIQSPGFDRSLRKKMNGEVVPRG